MADDWRNIKVNLKNQDLEAYVIVPLMGEDGTFSAVLTTDDVRKALKSKGVVNGVLDSEIERIFSESLFEEEILVAAGDPPRHGDNSRIEYYFETEQEFQPKEDDDGRIDYHEASILVNVEKGQELCRRYPPTEGTPGRSVTGEEIKPKEGKDKLLPEGPNTELSPGDPDLLIASSGGCVTLNRSKLVEVQPKLDIKGDVDFSTGNIRFDGSLTVGGDVKAGFKVEVTGDLEVGGVVEDAEVTAGGCAMIKKGFIGHGKGKIKTGSDLTVKFAQNQAIVCQGDLICGGELMHCNGKVGGDVKISGRKGLISGGAWLVEGSVEAPQIGSISYTNTEITVGCDFRLIERRDEIKDELEKIEANRDKIKKALYNLSRLKIKMKGELPPEQEKLYDRLQDTMAFLPQQKEQLSSEMAGIKEKMNEHRNACVKVSKVLYPGVKVSIGKFSRVFNEKVERTTLREVKGEIVPSA